MERFPRNCEIQSHEPIIIILFSRISLNRTILYVFNLLNYFRWLEWPCSSLFKEKSNYYITKTGQLYLEWGHLSTLIYD